MSIRFWLKASYRLLPAAFLALSMAPVAALASPPAAEAPQATNFVAVRDDYFAPANVTVPSGTSIRWTNTGEDYHTVTSDTGAFNSGYLYPGYAYSRTFVTPGTYTYHCQIHRAQGMVGTITVTGGGSVPPPSGDNLALGKPVQASSSQAGHSPGLAVDGSLNTYWSSSGLAAALDLDVVRDDPGEAVADFVLTPGGLEGSAGIDPLRVPGDVSSELAPPVSEAVVPDSHNPQWIYVDLQGTFSLRQFRMQWNAGHHARVYSVYVYRAGCGWCMLGRTSTGDGDDTLTLLNPVQARYALLSLSYPAIPNGAYQLREWEVRGSAAPTTPPPSESNLAVGRPAVASSEMAGYAASRVTDGEVGTAWRSAQIPAWIYVDLGRVSSVRRAVLKWTGGAHATRYGLYALVGGAWRAVFATNAGNGGDDMVTFPTVQTRYLLVYGTAGPASYLELGEFEIYGTSAASTYPRAEPVEADWRTEDAEPSLDALPALDLLDQPDGLLDDAGGLSLPELDAPSTEGFPSPES